MLGLDVSSKVIGTAEHFGANRTLVRPVELLDMFHIVAGCGESSVAMRTIARTQSQVDSFNMSLEVGSGEGFVAMNTQEKCRICAQCLLMMSSVAFKHSHERLPGSGII